MKDKRGSEKERGGRRLAREDARILNPLGDRPRGIESLGPTGPIPHILCLHFKRCARAHPRPLDEEQCGSSFIRRPSLVGWVRCAPARLTRCRRTRQTRHREGKVVVGEVGGMRSVQRATTGS